MTNNLPLLVLLEILDNVSDLSTIFSCILVNRQWCFFGIPYLWANPFAKSQGLTPLSTLRKLLTHEECTKLGINERKKFWEISGYVNYVLRKLHMYKEANSVMFDYPKLITTINFCCLKECCKREFGNNEFESAKIILGLLVRHKTHLKKVEVKWNEGAVFFEYSTLFTHNTDVELLL